MRSVVLSAALTLLAGTVSRAGDWPQWRGPHRDGHAAGARLPARWPAKPPTPLWRALVGDGYSSPVVAGGRVFIMGREDDKLETCLCFDADTGKRLWRHAYPAPYRPPDPCAGRWPKSTPTADRGMVYTLGLGGMFHCLDARTGRVVWKRDFAADFWGVEKDSHGDDAWFPSCGAAASALVDGDVIIVPVGGKKAGAFTAFERKTGRIVWKALAERSSYASPLFAELAGHRQLVAFTGLRMVGLDASSRKVLWDHPFPTEFEQTTITPVIWKDRVIVGGERKPTVALRIEGRDGKVSKTVAWRSVDLRLNLSTPVVVKDHLIGLDDRLQRLVCLDLASGATAWTSPRMSRYASLVVAGDQLLVLDSDGELHVLKADPRRHDEVARWEVSKEGGTWSHLAVVGNRLYLKDKQHLLCFEVRD